LSVESWASSMLLPASSGSGVLDEVEAALRRYVVFASEAQVTACALWVSHTYVASAAQVTPYLAVTSAEKQSGKSRLLEVLELLVCDAWKVVSPSAAVLYRTIDQLRPTLLIDEVDTIFNGQNNYEELRAVLNAGFQRGTTIPRWNAEQRTIEMFDPFCPKVLAGIGELPDTVQDRSIPIRLKRKLSTERVERFRRRQASQLAPLRDRLQGWGEGHATMLEGAEPSLPDELSDRQQDAWEILFAIADLVGGTWSIRARAAAVELAASRVDGQVSLGNRLLGDLQTLLNNSGNRHLTSNESLAYLNGLDDAPWRGWSNGTGLNSHGLNKLLRPYEIRTHDVRINDLTTAKGFHRDKLQEAFERWLPEPAHP
jgi:hypothetical protein